MIRKRHLIILFEKTTCATTKYRIISCSCTSRVRSFQSKQDGTWYRAVISTPKIADKKLPYTYILAGVDKRIWIDFTPDICGRFCCRAATTAKKRPGFWILQDPLWGLGIKKWGLIGSSNYLISGKTMKTDGLPWAMWHFYQLHRYYQRFKAR